MVDRTRAALGRKLQLDVESWRTEKQKQQQAARQAQAQEESSDRDDNDDGDGDDDDDRGGSARGAATITQKSPPSRTPRRHHMLPLRQVSMTGTGGTGVQQRAQLPQSQSTPALARIVLSGGSPPKMRQLAPPLLTLEQTKGVKDYAEESDIYEDIEVTLRNQATGETERLRLKIGETVQNIKKRIVARAPAGTAIEYRDVELVLDGRPMMDPLSLNDFPEIVAAKKADIKVVIRGAPQPAKPIEVEAEEEEEELEEEEEE
jgi:hypothetical protein